MFLRRVTQVYIPRKKLRGRKCNECIKDGNPAAIAKSTDVATAVPHRILGRVAAVLPCGEVKGMKSVSSEDNRGGTESSMGSPIRFEPRTQLYQIHHVITVIEPVDTEHSPEKNTAIETQWQENSTPQLRLQLPSPWTR